VNLLSNAVRFTPEGGRVTVGAQSLGPQVEVWVEDTGVGIPAEALPTLFDEFTQVSQGTDRAHEGTGLGLALVRRLVGLMGGRVDVRSEVGRGSRFTVTLPAAAADPGASQRATGSGGPAAGADAQPGEGEGGRTTRPGTVLVLDDDPMVGELSRQVLEDAGYRVVVTRTLAEARRALRERTPQVVLLDVVLAEGEDGYALLPDLRALDPPPATAVISIVDAGRRAMEPPVRLWLVKPVRPEALRQAVASLLAEGEVRHG
jgi:CheY-like chemotaxis protein/anti-sigma regulatory factor (Ser/Thr protein kinase)